MEFRSYRVKIPVKSFRDLEVYQKTIQLSDEITNLSFLNKESFVKDNEEIKSVAEKIPKLIAEAYGDKFDSKELAHKKLTEAITLITNAITKIDLLRQRFMDDKKPAPALNSSKTLPILPDNKSLSLDNNSSLPPAGIAKGQVQSPADVSTAVISSAVESTAEIRRDAKAILDNLLTRYQTQKIKVLNLRKAWQRVFTNYPQQSDRFNYKK